MLVINEDLLGPEAIADPYTYYGRLREEDPIHWNPLYETWVLTRYDDVVWALRHPEVFSSEIFLRDPHPPLPPILETDQALYEFNKQYLSHWFYGAMRLTISGCGGSFTRISIPGTSPGDSARWCRR